jgi:hypothetical protein
MVFIADNCAIYVDEIFSDYGELGGGMRSTAAMEKNIQYSVIPFR